MSVNQGWYFYGITECGGSQELLHGLEGMPGGAPLDLLEVAGLAAIVQPVPLGEFGPEALASRLDDATWVEMAARRHHEVVAALHTRRALLPARFGAVYAAPEDVRGAVRRQHAALRDQVRHVAACDEWGVQLHADLAVLLPALEHQSQALVDMERELAAATPGRAYLLRRKLASERNRAIDEGLRGLAEEAHGRLTHCAADTRMRLIGLASWREGDSSSAQGERVILKVDVLVPHARVETFATALETFAAAHEGLRWTCSGPWPPYSFVAPLAEPAKAEAG